MMRLLTRNDSGLIHFRCEDCFTGTVSDDSSQEQGGNNLYQVFSPLNPGGRYRLELHRPYHRSILRMLYKTCDRFQTPADQSFKDISWSSGSYQHPTTKDWYGIYPVAQQ